MLESDINSYNLIVFGQKYANQCVLFLRSNFSVVFLSVAWVRLYMTIEVNVFSHFKLCFVSGMVIVDAAGNIAAGTTTNGANHKIPG